MNYITIEAKTYEEAVKRARSQYGDRLRIHSRKDNTKPGFMGIGHVTSCEITCYLTGEEEKPAQKIIPEEKEDSVLIKRFENEAKTPNPDEIKKEPEIHVEPPVVEVDNSKAEAEILAMLEDVTKILRKNDFSEYYIRFLMDNVREQAMKALPDVPSRKDIETAVMDHMAGLLKIKKETAASKTTVFLGPAGSGKTTTAGKIAVALAKNGSKVGIISLHTKNDSPDLMKRICQAARISLLEAADSESLKAALASFDSYDSILIDTSGNSMEQSEMDRSILEALKACKDRMRFVLVLSAAMKFNDMDAMSVLYYPFEFDSLAFTGTDRTTTIGNVVSFSYEKKIPLEFMAFGRSIPRDMKTVTVSDVLNKMKGFTNGLFSI
ncbi:MAG: hypothetical protein K5634_05515 [Sphaerochaetaceae bacterium]|nr:hypothetical protein [Sphaerochaetaceae bacterium]